MKGIELSRKFYKEYGEPMLKNEFSDIIPYLAIGLAGSGSQCYGYDDNLSQDHDFSPAFCIFIPNEDIIDSKTAFRLERAYAKLPKSFMGFPKSEVTTEGGRCGVIRTGDFFEMKTGSRDGFLSISEWFSIPEYALCEAVNGEVFEDNFGEFTEIRSRLSYYPEDVRLKKLAGQLLLMGQSGQYNYNRSVSRGDTAAAAMSVYEFVKSALSVIFLINKTYMPYYKWSFRALGDLPQLSFLSVELEYLLSSGNRGEEAAKKSKIIEKICAAASEKLMAEGIINNNQGEMEIAAYMVNDNIKDNEIRNSHILSAV